MMKKWSKFQYNAHTVGTVGAITKALWILFTTSWNRLVRLTFATVEAGRDPKSELYEVEYIGGGQDVTIAVPNNDEVAAVGSALLRDHSEDCGGTGAAGANEISTSIVLDSKMVSEDTAGGGSEGCSIELFSTFFTASRMTLSSSLARLLTTGGVDEKAWRSAAISPGGCSASLNTRRFESTYLDRT